MAIHSKFYLASRDRFLVPLVFISLFLRLGLWSNILFVGIGSSLMLYIIYVGGDWWQQYRFISPIIPLLYVIVAGGLLLVSSAVSSFLHTYQTSIPAVVSKTVLLATMGGVLLAIYLPNHIAQANIKLQVPGERLLARGEYFRNYAQLLQVPQAKYLEPDVGGTSYVSGLTIVDLAMLADIHIARFKYADALFQDYIFNEQHPAFVRTHEAWTRRSKITTYPEFWASYHPIRVWRDEYGISGNFVRKDLFVREESTDYATNRLSLPSSGNTPVLRKFEAISAYATLGQAYQFTWDWQCPQHCFAKYHTWLILQHSETSDFVQYRFDPAFDLYPTSAWQPNEVIYETRVVTLPLGLQEGQYAVRIGFGNDSEPVQWLYSDMLTVDRNEAHQYALDLYNAHLNLLQNKKFEAAWSVLREARYLAPHDSGYRHAEHKLLQDWEVALAAQARNYFEHGDLDNTVKTFEQMHARRMSFRHPDTRALQREVRDYLMVLGNQQLAAHAYDAAYTAFHQALIVDPKHIWARHRLEDTREYQHYISLYCAAGNARRVWEMYQREVQAGNVPTDEEIEELFFCLQSVADSDTLAQWRQRFTLPSIDNPIILYEHGLPKLRVLGYRGHQDYVYGGRVELILEVLESLDRDYQLWLHGEPSGEGQPFEHQERLPTSQWQAGHIYRQIMTLSAAPDTYTVQFGFRFDDQTHLSFDANSTQSVRSLGQIEILDLLPAYVTEVMVQY